MEGLGPLLMEKKMHQGLWRALLADFCKSHPLADHKGPCCQQTCMISESQEQQIMQSWIRMYSKLLKEKSRLFSPSKSPLREMKSWILNLRLFAKVSQNSIFRDLSNQKVGWNIAEIESRSKMRELYTFITWIQMQSCACHPFHLILFEVCIANPWNKSSVTKLFFVILTSWSNFEDFQVTLELYHSVSYSICPCHNNKWEILTANTLRKRWNCFK